jgi:outer membrane protein assembly factor BamB
MRWTAGLILGVTFFFFASRPAEAVIIRLTPLSEVLEASTWIVTAKVDSLDEKRPAMMLVVDEKLKGKPTQTKIPVLLKGDKGAITRKEPPQLLKRLETKLPLVLFITSREEKHIAFAFTNGTWFSLDGVKVDGELRWSFSHLEPYLRRTYKGTTAEMAQTVRDALSGKRKPPGVDKKAKPGLGPEVAPAKKTSAREPWSEPHRAVIPTVLVGGPLAMLAMLFPAVFGGWRRWFVLLSTAGTTSTLFTLHWLFLDSLAGSWWGTAIALWALMTAVTVLGMAWAWNRHLVRVQTGEAPLVPGNIELSVLLVLPLLGLIGLVVVRGVLRLDMRLKDWWPVFALGIALGGGALYGLWARFVRGPQITPAIATEAIVLTVLVLAHTFFGPALGPAMRAGGLEGASASGTRDVRLVWTFRLPAKGAISSSPVVVGERVYVGAAHDDVFSPYGAVYCLDRGTGKVLWTFDDKKKMKQIFSSPVVVGDRLYIGEGFHQDFECRVFCLNAEKGEKIWELATGSHTESTPCVVDGRVYCGAGDDGLYCIDAAKGTKVWNFPSFHIDASPVVVGDRVYAGCGIGDAYKTTALFCLDVKKGQPRWRYNTELPVWSRPVVASGFLYAGVGNGRFNESDDKPAGGVVCLSASDGKEVWKKKMPDGVLGRIGADKRHLFFGCRDGYFYCLRRSDGAQVWRRDMGSAVVAGPALEAHSSHETPAERLYAASTEGFLACMEPATGQLVWSRNLGADIELISTPALDVRSGEDGAEVRRLYVGLTLNSSARIGELHCYEETETAKE